MVNGVTDMSEFILKAIHTEHALLFAGLTYGISMVIAGALMYLSERNDRDLDNGDS